MVKNISRVLLLCSALAFFQKAFSQEVNVKMALLSIPNIIKGDSPYFTNTTQPGIGFEAYAAFGVKKISGLYYEAGFTKNNYNAGYESPNGKDNGAAGSYYGLPIRLSYKLLGRYSQFSVSPYIGASINLRANGNAGYGTQVDKQKHIDTTSNEVREDYEISYSGIDKAALFPAFELGFRAAYTTKYHLVFKLGLSRQVGIVPIFELPVEYKNNLTGETHRATYRNYGGFTAINLSIGYNFSWRKEAKEPTRD